MPVEGKPGKEYGLIIKSNKVNPPVRPVKQVASVFNNEDDDEDLDEGKFKSMKIDTRKETFMAQMKKAIKVNFDQALVDDPTIFEYDEQYEKFAKKEEKPVEKTYQPKYINKLLKSASEKKLERELQNERKAQKEILAEKDKYGNKEEFVTSSYKKKMEEINELVDKREKESQLDERVDVTKQNNINAFYRYMYHNTDGKEKSQEDKEKINKDEIDNAEPSTSSAVQEKFIVKSPEMTKLPEPSKTSRKEHSSRRETESSRSRHKDERSPKRSDHHRSSHRSDRHKSDHHRSSHRSDHRRRSRSRDRGHPSTSRSSKGTPEPTKKPTEKIDSDVRRFDENGNEIFSTKTSQYWEKFFDPTKKSGDKQKGPKDPDVPEGCVRAKPRVTTDAELEEYKIRYLQRKAEGLPKPEVVDSDDEFAAPIND